MTNALTVMMEKGKIKTWGTSGTDLWPKRFTFRVHKGWHVRPIRPICFWLSKNWNCWQGAPPWFTLKFPIIFFFFSVKIGKGGFYIGTKVYEHDIHNTARYSLFLGGWPFGEYLTFSFRIKW